MTENEAELIEAALAWREALDQAVSAPSVFDEKYREHGRAAGRLKLAASKVAADRKRPPTAS